MTYCLTCEYDACEKIKISKLFDWLNIKDDTCKKKIARINRILRNFYIDTVEFDQNRVSEEIVCEWDSKITTLYPIYKLRWFYWIIDDTTQHCYKACIQPWAEDEICITCSSDPQKTFLLKTFPTKNDERMPWQYTRVCENTIFFNPYDCFDRFTIEYTRWPLEITNIDSEIQIDSQMLIALEYLIEMHYALRDDEYNRANKYQELYIKSLQQLSQNNSFIPYSVWPTSNNTKYI